MVFESTLYNGWDPLLQRRVAPVGSHLFAPATRARRFFTTHSLPPWRARQVLPSMLHALAK